MITGRTASTAIGGFGGGVTGVLLFCVGLAHSLALIAAALIFFQCACGTLVADVLCIFFPCGRQLFAVLFILLVLVAFLVSCAGAAVAFCLSRWEGFRFISIGLRLCLLRIGRSICRAGSCARFQISGRPLP